MSGMRPHPHPVRPPPPACSPAAGGWPLCESPGVCTCVSLKDSWQPSRHFLYKLLFQVLWVNWYLVSSSAAVGVPPPPRELGESPSWTVLIVEGSAQTLPGAPDVRGRVAGKLEFSWILGGFNPALPAPPSFPCGGCWFAPPRVPQAVCVRARWAPRTTHELWNV